MSPRTVFAKPCFVLFGKQLSYKKPSYNNKPMSEPGEEMGKDYSEKTFKTKTSQAICNSYHQWIKVQRTWTHQEVFASNPIENGPRI